MKQPYNTALYMRLSRDDENYGDSVSIGTQRTILRQYARDNSLHVVLTADGQCALSEVPIRAARACGENRLTNIHQKYL